MSDFKYFFKSFSSLHLKNIINFLVYVWLFYIFVATQVLL